MFESLKIKSMVAREHNTSFGGYPFKVVVEVSLDAKVFNKLKGDLGSLVLTVNNMIYKLNPNIRSYSPSIDSRGSSRAKAGVKTLTFEYFDKDLSRAKALGMDVKELKNGEMYLGYNSYVDLIAIAKQEIVT